MNNENENAIYPGLTVEEMRAVFFDANALKEPPYKVYQLNSEGHRYYYRFDDAGEPQFFPSVTTLLKQTMPTPPSLIDWIAANGKDGATEKRDLAALYGTFMHIQFEKLIVSRKYDFDGIVPVLLQYMDENNVPEKCFNEWVVKIRKDVLAFAQFLRDYNVKPLAIEIGLVHPVHHYAGCIDFPCEMTDPKSGEVFRAIVDFKSGRKGFYEENELQLHLYGPMWNVNFPDTPISRYFNFSPKDWRTKPTYNLKEQTDSPNAAKIPHLLALARIEDEKRDNTLTIVRGTLDLDNGKILDNVLSISLSELIKSRKDEQHAPEDAANGPDLFPGGQKPADGQEKPVETTKATEPINPSSEQIEPVKTENTGNLPDDAEKLPWEKEESEQAPSGPIMSAPTPAENPEQGEDNLLQTENELF